ncbi:hypothetical protein EXS62_01570 [Candidatus Kaiserbacteria bacterium]|nr:hypothetical protein [Candidatus Kaiserbacteria bacterium]
MQHIKAHMQSDSPRSKRERATERGELMKYFMEHLNTSRKRDGLPLLTMPRMGRLLLAIPTKDLYYLQSVCDQAKDFSKKFWWEINPKNHPEKNEQK